MIKEMLGRPVLDYLARNYYRFFVSSTQQHVVGQDYFLFSFRYSPTFLSSAAARAFPPATLSIKRD
jgi:hypothetical protein